jgi:hypothetical protein
MTFGLPAPLAILASHNNEAIEVCMRLSSIVLYSISLLTSGVAYKYSLSLSMDGFGELWTALLMIASGTLIVLTSIYVLISSRIVIAYPVTITVELVTWSLALSIALVASLSLRDLYQGTSPDWSRLQTAVVISCMLLFITLYVLSSHLINYWRD